MLLGYYLIFSKLISPQISRISLKKNIGNFGYLQGVSSIEIRSQNIFTAAIFNYIIQEKFPFPIIIGIQVFHHPEEQIDLDRRRNNHLS